MGKGEGGRGQCCQSECAHQIAMAFSSPVVGCLLKKGLLKGYRVHGHLSHLATPLGTVLSEDALLMWNQALKGLAIFVQVKRYHLLPDKPMDLFS